MRDIRECICPLICTIIIFSKAHGMSYAALISNNSLKILEGKKHPKIKLYEKTHRLRKIRKGHLGRWYIKLTLFKRF